MKKHIIKMKKAAIVTAVSGILFIVMMLGTLVTGSPALAYVATILGPIAAIVNTIAMVYMIIVAIVGARKLL